MRKTKNNKLANPDDLYLMQQYRSGNDDAFNCLYYKYKSKISSYLYRLTSGDSHLTKDLSQEVYLFLIIHIRTGKVYENLERFIIYKTYQIYIDHLRKNKPASLPEAFEINNILSSSLNREEEYLLEDTLKSVETLINSLNCRKVVYLHYFENKSYKSISEEFRIPEKTLLSKVRRDFSIAKRNYRNININI
jgi:RNA polymerase sigma-70 factor, ECF subfamily